MNPTLEMSVSDLKNALLGLAKVINAKTRVPALSSVRIESSTEGMATVQATDLDSFATCQLLAEVTPGFPACVVSFSDLNKLVKVAKDRIALLCDDPDKVRVRYNIGASQVVQAVSSVPAKDWPEVPVVEPQPVTLDPGFKEVLRYAMECVSSDCSRQVLGGACLDIRQTSGHYVVASDGRHAFTANTFTFAIPKAVIVPSRRFLQWSSFSEDGDWSLALQCDKEGKPAWIRFQSNRWNFITGAIEGEYPNWPQIMPAEDREFTRVTFGEDSVAALLDILPSLPGYDATSQPVSLQVTAQGLKIMGHAQGSESWTEVHIPGVVVDGKEQTYTINRSYFTKALRFGFKELQIENAVAPVLFWSPGRKMVVAQMNVPVPTLAPPTQPVTPPPSEAVVSATPPAPQPETPAEPRNPMPTPTTVMTAPERGNQPVPKLPEPEEVRAGVKPILDRIDQIKGSLRGLIGDLNEIATQLRSAEKEQRAASKEFQTVRNKLREIQSVQF